ncbi:hypothetical protein [Rhizobium sp. MHM7A]|uniref:hypothetical protein n=1 Tax=Rhizobium sp. MHM7A TaxID=2583233 RepID=UPI00110756DD|nr:hypothetical protein [Rhizobium sp. MHM7A]TLX16262.1 hypothetical protein FFR93_02740 [Rhizobium sp. MHM7A]
MSLDYNAHARALIANNMTEDDVYKHVFQLRSLVAELLSDEAVEIAPEKREQLQASSEALRKVLTPMFHPVGIHSDPFVPRYAGEQIRYFADERGLAVLVADKDGQGVMYPDFHLSSDVLKVDSDYVQERLKAKAGEWELPFKESYVVVDAALEQKLAEAYEAANPAPGPTL